MSFVIRVVKKRCKHSFITQCREASVNSIRDGTVMNLFDATFDLFHVKFDVQHYSQSRRPAFSRRLERPQRPVPAVGPIDGFRDGMMEQWNSTRQKSWTVKPAALWIALLLNKASASTLRQLWDDTIMLFPLKRMKSLKNAAPFWSDSIVFNKNSIANIITELS